MTPIKNAVQNTEVEKLLDKYGWEITCIEFDGRVYKLNNENYFPEYFYIEIYLTKNNLACFVKEFVEYLENYNGAEDFFEEVSSDTEATNYFDQVCKKADFWESVGKQHIALAKELKHLNKNEI